MRWFLIDQLLECEPGRRAVGVKTFPLSDLFFLDHFTANPIVPGVLQIEMVAQTGGKSLRLLRPEMQALIGSVKSAKFIRPIRPGDRCRITVDIVTHSDYAIESGIVEVDGVRVCQAELLAVFVPRALAEPPEQDLIIGAWQRRHGGQHEPLAVGERAHTVVA